MGLEWWRVRAAVGGVRALVRGGAQVVLGRPGADAERSPMGAVDHGAFIDLLARYVDDLGLVRYATWRATPSDLTRLDDYLAALGRADPRQPSTRADRLAFWINAYNAVTLAGILRANPDGCACRHHGSLLGYSLWRDLRLPVGDMRVSLDQMEHRFLRPEGEPLVHFALVCAAKGCPPLRAYTAAGLDEQLADNARRFLARPDAFRADSVARTAHLSRLLKWYRRDFAPTPAGVVQALRPYLPNRDDLAWLDAGGFAVTYTAYDWSLNDAAPATACEVGTRDRRSPR